MNYSIVYATSTGNTKLLADNVEEVLGSECVYFGQADEKAKIRCNIYRILDR